MGRITMLLELANNDDRAAARRGDLAEEEVRALEIDGIVDTGAAQLVIPKAVADALGVPKVGTAGVKFADGRRAERDVVSDVWLRLLGRDAVFKAVVEPGRDDALIGAIVLEALDLLPDPIAGTCHPRDPEHMIAEM